MPFQARRYEHLASSGRCDKAREVTPNGAQEGTSALSKREVNDEPGDR